MTREEIFIEVCNTYEVLRGVSVREENSVQEQLRKIADDIKDNFSTDGDLLKEIHKYAQEQILRFSVGGNFMNQIHNAADMIEGCKNRMCITDDENELSRLYESLNLYAADLFRMNLRRIRSQIL